MLNDIVLYSSPISYGSGLFSYFFLFLRLREAISLPFTFVTFVPVMVWSLSRCINIKFLYGIS